MKRLDTDSHSGERARKRVLTGLFWLRNVAIAAQLVVVLLVVFGLGIQLYLMPVLAIIAALWLWNLLVGWRLGRDFSVSAGEIAWNLAVDMMALAALLYWTGGSTNPFVSLFLVPVALAAAFLPVRYVAATVMLAAALYTVLLWRYVPLAPVGSRFGGDFNLHVWGMWASFILSAIIAAVFVYQLASAGRRREHELAKARETLLRNEHIVAAGALAAGAAHEMNTPLSTIGLLAQELVETSEDSSQVRADAREILAQVDHCKTRLQRLQRSAEPAGASGAGNLLQALENWAALRSDVQVKMALDLDDVAPGGHLDGLAMALTNLLDNAADASLEQGHARVEVRARREDDSVVVEIDDFGKGLSAEQLKKAGRASFSSKDKGLGLGLVLSHATLENIGARLSMMNRAGGGLRTRIVLPLVDDADE